MFRKSFLIFVFICIILNIMVNCSKDKKKEDNPVAPSPVQTPSPPPAITLLEGDTCQNPIIIPSIDFITISGDTTGMINDYGSKSNYSCILYSGSDIVYQYTTPLPSILNITITPSSNFDAVLRVVKECNCSILNFCIAGVNNGMSGDVENLNIIVDPGTYYIMIGGYYSNGPFILQMQRSNQ